MLTEDQYIKTINDIARAALIAMANHCTMADFNMQKSDLTAVILAIMYTAVNTKGNVGITKFLALAREGCDRLECGDF